MPMRDTSTSCGLRPRLRRDLNHAQSEDTIVFSFLNATIGCQLTRLRCLGAPFGSLSAGSDHQDAPSSCQRLTRGCPDAAEAVWRRPRAAWMTKKLQKSLQKRSSERLRERSEPQGSPGEPQTTNNLKNTVVFSSF